MTEEQIHPSQPSDGELGNRLKRKRTPSLHATLIESFKNNQSLSCKKGRSSKSINEEDISLEIKIQNPSDKILTCILPSGKQLKVKLVLQRASPKRRCRPQQTTKSVKLCAPVEDKPKEEPDGNFLQKLLSMVEQLKDNPDDKNQKNVTLNKPNPEGRARKQSAMLKKEKDRDDKLLRNYERVKNLGERFAQLEEKLLFLS